MERPAHADARPTLYTRRFILRPFHLADAPDVRRYAGDFAVAMNTLVMPHPYDEGMAEAWISTHQELFMRGEELVLAVVERHTGTLVGCVGLQLSRAHSHAELGYWVAPPAWGKGVATEASRALVGHAFTELRMQRVWAQHFSRNVASGRVMQKIGMRHEGTLRRHYRRFGELLDAEVYGLLSSEWVPGEGG